MKIPLSWVREYVELKNNSVSGIADALTQAGLEVEGIEENDILSIKVTSNRGDCLSVLGIARELSAVYNTPLKQKKFPFVENKNLPVQKHVRVSVTSKTLCPRYSARLVKNVQIAESPQWLQEKLKACGLKPINNIVDITNLVCLEFGQPMHAFDYEKLAGGKIIVRKAKEGEKLVTLDENEITLDGETLVIADEEKPVALAGVMGGLETGVTENTKHILLESANFSQGSIRRASKKYMLRTESSYRFERGVDIEGTVRALDYACHLILETSSSADAAKGVVDVRSAKKKETKKILLTALRCNSLLGTLFSEKQIAGFLTRLHFTAKITAKSVTVTVPSYRQDVRLDVDLIEEVARLYGYNNIKETIARAPIMSGAKNKEFEFQKVVRDLCLKLGLQEAHTHSLVSPQLVQKCLMKPEWDIPVRNPVSEEASLLRGSLLPSLLDVAARNVSHQEENLHIFELARTYHYWYKEGERKPAARGECLSLAVLMTGTPVTNPWNAKEDAADNFYYLKGTLELFLSRLGIKNVTMKNEKTFSYHPYNSGGIYAGSKLLGHMGEIHPQVAQNFGITKKVYIFELDDVTQLYSPDAMKKSYAPIPRFPSVHRDIAFFMDKNIPQSRIAEIINNSGGNLLESISLFDVYEGNPVPENMKSLAYALTFRHAERTLKSEEADAIMSAMKDALKKEGAALRE